MENKAFVTEICDLMEQFGKAKSAWVREFGTEEGFNEWAIKRMGFNKNKHTAGPWSTGFGYRPQINSADGRCVAWAETLGDISHTSEEHANAALIASAPELLEACQFVLQEWNEPEAVPEALDRLRKAIAKAEGK